MRLLVACQKCHRQYDASNREIGSRFRCYCGQVVKVTTPRSQEATVVKCSSCGGTREANSRACGFCGSDFTLLEKDMNTICPSCCARVSDKAKFCHHCGERMLVESLVTEQTKFMCPVCENSFLNGRRLGKLKASCLECQVCAGFWIGNETLEYLCDQAEVNLTRIRSHLDEMLIPPNKPPIQKGPMYRKCPECRRMMARKTFGRASGVIIDLCRNHGTWFDEDELRQVIDWIENGGMAKSNRLQEIEEKARQRRRKEYQDQDRNRKNDFGSATGIDEFGPYGGIIGGIFDLF